RRAVRPGLPPPPPTPPCPPAQRVAPWWAAARSAPKIRSGGSLRPPPGREAPPPRPTPRPESARWDSATRRRARSCHSPVLGRGPGREGVVIQDDEGADVQGGHGDVVYTRGRARGACTWR